MSYGQDYDQEAWYEKQLDQVDRARERECQRADDAEFEVARLTAEVERYKSAFVKANEAVTVREEAIVRRDKVLNDVLAALTQGITTDKAARIAAIQVLDAARAEVTS